MFLILFALYSTERTINCLIQYAEAENPETLSPMILVTIYALLPVQLFVPH